MATGGSVATFTEVQCLTPRGRYAIKIYPAFLQLHGKKFDYKIPYTSVLSLFLLPHKDGRKMFFVVCLDPPIKQGNTCYPFLICLFNKEEAMSLDLALSEKDIEEKYDGKLAKEMNGAVYDVISKVMEAVVNRKITCPGSFTGHSGTHAISCSCKAVTGFLYPLESEFIFVKPPLHIQLDEVVCVNFARSIGATTRSSRISPPFTFEIETKDGSVHTFTNIEKDEYTHLYDFVSNKTLRVRVKNIDNKDIKEHVKALCNPTEKMVIPYPKSLREMLTSPETHGRLEEQSKAAVIFPDDVDKAIIYGTELTVTLAVSALEDLIEKYEETVMEEDGSDSISNFNRSLSVVDRLNHQLNEAISAREDIDLDVSQNETMNNAVKRVLLSWLSQEDKDETIIVDTQPVSEPSPSPSARDDLSDYYTTAERIGYTKEEVDSVVERFGTQLITAEFIKRLEAQTANISDALSCSTPLAVPDGSKQLSLEHDKNVKTSASNEESRQTISDLVDGNSNQSQVRKADFAPDSPKNERKKKKANLETDEPCRSTCRSRSPIDNRAEKIAAIRDADDDLDGKYGRRATHQSTAGPSGSQWGSTSNQQQESLVCQLQRFHPYQALMPEPSQTVIRNSKDLRYIVIDASNIAMAHGTNKEFSCKGIKIAVDYFLKRGHKDVTAFVPQFRQRGFNYRNPVRDQQILTDLHEKGYLVFTPSRKVDGRYQVCYDDKFIVQLAAETDGVIVSNDNYRDLMNQRPEWRHIIVNRLLMYSFVRDMFMLPDDPHGRNGPTLDQLLSQVPLHQLNRGFDPRGIQNQIPGIRSERDLLAEQNRPKRFGSTPMTQYHQPSHANTRTRYQNTNRGGYDYRPRPLNNAQRNGTTGSSWNR